MGFGSITHWLIVLAIVLVIFGTKKLRTLGSDLGGAIRNFKESMKSEEEKRAEAAAAEARRLSENTRVVDAEVTSKEQRKV